MKFHVAAPKVGAEGTFEYDFGTSVDEAVKKFGEEVVFNYFRQAAIIKAQGFVRRKLEAGASVEEAQEALNGWTPGAIQRQAKSKKEKVLSFFSSLSDEEKLEVLKALKQRS